MQFPDDWSHKHRNGLAVQQGAGGSETALRPPRNISSSELDTFAQQASLHHVNVNSLFMRSISNDTGSVGERILALLPTEKPANIDASVQKNKRKNNTPPLGSARLPKRVCVVKDSDVADNAAVDGCSEKFSRCDMRLELDTLLSRLPYKRMMQVSQLP